MAYRYPVQVTGDLDEPLSRWLWLVKWLLAIPHLVVLFFLYLAFLVLSIVAFFAILITARYPRGIFTFNVGVMRWSWRVSFYTYSALGTDRYPPFTLRDVPDYPAHLEIDYPERLSRGLVLVKWWLLAIPHYIVVGLIVTGTSSVATTASGGEVTASTPGLVSVLVFFAGVILLFKGRYPQPLFDLVVGLNRWSLRVSGYAALMTDVYPPFRLDQGGREEEPAPSAGPGGTEPTWTGPGGAGPGGAGPDPVPPFAPPA